MRRIHIIFINSIIKILLILLNLAEEMDCTILKDAMISFIEIFSKCFNAQLLDKLSLPGISEDIMWSF